MYGKLPEVIDIVDINVEEMFSYTYLPIKLAYPDTGTRYYLRNIEIEPRLEPFRKLINTCCEDYQKNIDKKEWYYTYVYLTVKNLYQKENRGFNREGWHSDGIFTNDINYIWSSNQPTIFNDSRFNLSPCDERSMDEMIFQAKKENNKTYPNKTLLKLDQYVIHRVGPIEEGMRCFFKLSFSKDRYDLKGNSHNYLLDYNWEMRDRQIERNIPQKLGR